jgi:FAD/FMN-containing dehydrogenase/Fe-S oxidoreductase
VVKDPFVEKLRSSIGRGKIASDRLTRTAYANDASIYWIPPRAVVFPENGEDVARAVSVAREFGISITTRAGGSSLSGAAVGTGLVVDVGRMRRVDIGQDSSLARSEAGVIYADLNRIACRHGRVFAPDPASGAFCKIGGMLGNNSSGPHTVRYGMTVDHVRSVDVVLADSTRITAQCVPLDSRQAEEYHKALPGLRRFISEVRASSDEIRSRWPRVRKNASGYNLKRFIGGLEENRLDLPALLIGSEGTLGVFVAAELSLVPLPGVWATGLAYFQSLQDAGRAAADLLSQHPLSVELVDSSAMDFLGRERFDLPERAEAMLLVEVDDKDVSSALSEVKDTVSRYDLAAPFRTATDTDEQDSLWKARKSLLAALYTYDVRKRPVALVEDLVVAPDRIAELVGRLRPILERRVGSDYVIYGHVGDGNIHLHPLLDLTDPDVLADVDLFCREIYDIAADMNGSPSGEHGDGRVRAPYVERFFGLKLMSLFRQLRSVFDPEGILSPDIKTARAPVSKNVGRTKHLQECLACGACVAVCPSYEATRSEVHSPRGRLTLLGAKPNDPAFFRAARTCLDCKQCRVVCPANIDAGGAVGHWLAGRCGVAANAVFSLLRSPVLFGLVVRMANAARPIWDSKTGRELLSRSPVLPIPSDVMLPALRLRTLQSTTGHLRGGADAAYFHGCAENYCFSGAAESVLAIAKHLRLSLAVPRQWCSGTPHMSHGREDLARLHAKRNIAALEKYGIVVTTCSSCLLGLRDMPRLFETGSKWRKRAEIVAGRSIDVAEYLSGRLDGRFRPDAPMLHLTYHAPCHGKVTDAAGAAKRLLDSLPNVERIEVEEERCIGWGGVYRLSNPEESLAIWARTKATIKRTGTTLVATSCPNSLFMLADRHDDGLRGVHVAAVAASALGIDARTTTGGEITLC